MEKHVQYEGFRNKKAGWIIVSVGAILGAVGCDDDWRSPALSSSMAKSVEVSLCVSLADEEDGSMFRGNSTSSLGDRTIGSSFNVTLTPMSDCQLLIIARGYNGTAYTVKSLTGLSLSSTQSTTATTSAIEGITTQEDIKAMPYILHLPHVNVTEEGRIESRDGVDIRILLRRLATRLTV